ncbi:hypothetical protein F4801DRAFT_561589 [Xylaria longipes]|nr:hypothetical protein F4801DRAFT_561589 [Xylaria longipes]
MPTVNLEVVFILFLICCLWASTTGSCIRHLDKPVAVLFCLYPEISECPYGFEVNFFSLQSISRNMSHIIVWPLSGRRVRLCRIARLLVFSPRSRGKPRQRNRV